MARNREKYVAMLASLSYPALLSLASMAKMPYLPPEVPYREKMAAMRQWLEDEWDLNAEPDLSMCPEYDSYDNELGRDMGVAA